MSGLTKKPYPKVVKLQVKLLKKQGKKSEAKTLKESAKNKLKRGMAGK